MPPRITQEEWQQEAERVHLEWLEPVPNASTPTRARCLLCRKTLTVLPRRTRDGRGCPTCLDKRRVPPDAWEQRALAAGIEWLEPVAHARSRTLARCTACQHEWRPWPDAIASGHGCPRCARKRVAESATGAKIAREEWDRRADAVGIEWVGAEPILTTQKRAARCRSCGHEWKASPGRVAKGSGCPRCAAAARRISRAEWDRRATSVGIEWLADPPDNSTPTPARCSTCGHEWRPRAGNVQQGLGCPRCAGQVVTPEDYHESASALGIAWLEEPIRGSHKTPARCLSCGREWTTTPKAVRRGAGCDPCRRKAGNLARRVPPEEWDRRADAVGIEWVGAEPILTTQKRAARCRSCGHEWRVAPDSVKQGHGCPRCAGMIVTPDEWAARAEARGFRWLAPVRSTSEPVRAQCITCSYEWSPWPGDRKGCPRCAGKVVTQEQWAERAEAVGIEWTGDEPIRSSQKHAARCLGCGREWDASPEHVQQGQGCASCASWGFDPSQPTFVYLLRTDTPRLLMKVGVTNEGSSRLSQHQANGWGVVATWLLPTGATALAVERATLDWWRGQRAAFASRDETPGRDGFTEVVHIGTVDVPDTQAFIESLLSDVRTMCEPDPPNSPTP